MLVRSCFLITLIKCLKGHKSLGSLCNVKSKSTVSDWVSQSVSQWQGHLLSCSGQLKSKTCSDSCDLSTNFNNSQWQILCQGHSFIQKSAGFLYQNEISSFVYNFGRGWSWPALPCGLYKPVITTSQGCISDVCTVPKCPQRNKW